MNFQNDRYTLRLAVPEDDAGILDIFKSGSFAGGLNVQYLRPAPISSFAADGDEARMLVIADNVQHRIAAVGGAVVQTLFLHGNEERCAYLTGLKIHPDYQKQIFFIARAYQFLGEQLTDCKACYTTILDDNADAIRMLEKRRRNMPEYRYVSHITTYCFHGGRDILPIEEGNMQGFDELMERHFAGLDLAPVTPDYRGFGEKRFFSYRENGELQACCYVGDQRATKQYRMVSYGGIYKLAAMLPTAWLGYPAFPKAGQIIPHGVVSFLYVRDNDPKLCHDFLRRVAGQTDLSLLLWACSDDHPLAPAMQTLRAVHYGSRLYEVQWNGAPPAVTGIPGLEAGLL